MRKQLAVAPLVVTLAGCSSIPSFDAAVRTPIAATAGQSTTDAPAQTGAVTGDPQREATTETPSGTEQTVSQTASPSPSSEAAATSTTADAESSTHSNVPGTAPTTTTTPPTTSTTTATITTTTTTETTNVIDRIDVATWAYDRVAADTYTIPRGGPATVYFHWKTYAGAKEIRGGCHSSITVVGAGTTATKYEINCGSYNPGTAFALKDPGTYTATITVEQNGRTPITTTKEVTLR